MYQQQNILHGDALDQLKTIQENTIDCIVTDPPYGYGFMNKDWDRVVVSTDIWKECLRVLKAGGFAFIMCAPRQDVLSRQIVNLQDAGFETGFTSIYWTYASGFPKAADVSKLVDKRNGTLPEQSRQFAEYIKSKRTHMNIGLTEIDKQVCNGTTNYSWFEGRPAGQRLPRQMEYDKIKIILKLDNRFDNLIGEAEREIIGKSDNKIHLENLGDAGYKEEWNITRAATDKAKQLDGSYCGFQPKPAVEVVLVVMKPLSEKSYVDQALANKHGITWLDSVRIPYQSEDDKDIRPDLELTTSTDQYRFTNHQRGHGDQSGRFPANLLVSDDCLNDGKIRTSNDHRKQITGKPFDPANGWNQHDMKNISDAHYGDSGSFSRYFDLDRWYETTFPFMIVPKADKAEKNKGLDQWLHNKVNDGRKTEIDNPFQRGETMRRNIHPTVKPLKVFCYLITMGSREGDTILDPFCGSGTSLVAAYMTHRKGIGIEINKEYVDIANARLSDSLLQTKLV